METKYLILTGSSNTQPLGIRICIDVYKHTYSYKVCVSFIQDLGYINNLCPKGLANLGTVSLIKAHQDQDLSIEG